jgi:hypothetical protein
MSAGDPSGLVAPIIGVGIAAVVGGAIGGLSAFVTDGSVGVGIATGAASATGMALVGMAGLGAAATAYAGGAIGAVTNLTGQMVEGKPNVDLASLGGATVGGALGGAVGSILGGTASWIGKVGTETIGAFTSTATDLGIQSFFKPPKKQNCP